MANPGEVTVGKAAAMLGISDQTVRNYIDDHLLRARRLPKGHRRVAITSIEELAATDDLPDEERRAALAELRRRNGATG